MALESDRAVAQTRYWVITLPSGKAIIYNAPHAFSTNAIYLKNLFSRAAISSSLNSNHGKEVSQRDVYHVFLGRNVIYATSAQLRAAGYVLSNTIAIKGREVFHGDVIQHAAHIALEPPRAVL